MSNKDHSGIIDGESLEDQIAREIKELLSVSAILEVPSVEESRFAYIADKAAWIARGAAAKARREERLKQPTDVAVPRDSPLVETFPQQGFLVNYLTRQWAWSLKTFGPALRTLGVTDHIMKEVEEVRQKPYDLSEWLDIVILALDGYWRHGGSLERLETLLQAKQDKNFARKWPAWQERSEDQAIEHDRSDEKSS